MDASFIENAPKSLNRLKLIDDMLVQMRQSGYQITSELISFMWRAANGVATSEEIEVFTLSMAESLKGVPQKPALARELEAVAMQIAADLADCRRRLDACRVV